MFGCDINEVCLGKNRELEHRNLAKRTTNGWNLVSLNEISPSIWFLATFHNFNGP